MRLARKNDDPVLLRDLQKLTGRGGDIAVLDDPSTTAPPPPVSADLEAAKAALRAFKRPPLPPEIAKLSEFEQRFVRLSIHVRRFLPFYAGAAMWLLAIVLIQPLGGNGAQQLAGAVSGPAAARTGVRAAATTPAASVESAPVFDDFGGSSVGAFDFEDDATTFAPSSSDNDSADLANDEPVVAAEEPAPTTVDTPAVFADDGVAPAPPSSLTVLASGYASTTGGTPLEQDPVGGLLPVHVVGGNVTKFSFVRLIGDDPVLRLKVAAGGVNADAAAVRACVATTAWQPARGIKPEAAPKFDPARCATGRPGAPGVREFDLEQFGVLGDGNGFVLTVGADTAPPTYQLAFEPVAVPSAG